MTDKCPVCGERSRGIFACPESRAARPTISARLSRWADRADELAMDEMHANGHVNEIVLLWLEASYWLSKVAAITEKVGTR